MFTLVLTTLSEKNMNFSLNYAYDKLFIMHNCMLRSLDGKEDSS